MTEDIGDKRDAPEQAPPEDEARIGETPAVLSSSQAASASSRQPSSTGLTTLF